MLHLSAVEPVRVCRNRAMTIEVWILFALLIFAASRTGQLIRRRRVRWGFVTLVAGLIFTANVVLAEVATVDG